jgi:hypothetical protein
VASLPPGCWLTQCVAAPSVPITCQPEIAAAANAAEGYTSRFWYYQGATALQRTSLGQMPETGQEMLFSNQYIYRDNPLIA